MQLTVILPTKQNDDLHVSLLSQMDEKDELIVFDLPKFPAKRMEEAIKNAKHPVILIINYSLPLLPQGFIQNIKDNCNSNFIYIKGIYDSVVEGYTLGDHSNFKNSDSIWFHKKDYKVRLRDFSSSMDYEHTIRALINIIRHKVYFPKSRRKETHNEDIKSIIVETINESKSKKEIEREDRRKEEQVNISMEKERKKAVEEHKKNKEDKRLMKRSFKRIDNFRKFTVGDKKVYYQPPIQKGLEERTSLPQVDLQSVSIREIKLYDDEE